MDQRAYPQTSRMSVWPRVALIVTRAFAMFRPFFPSSTITCRIQPWAFTSQTNTPQSLYQPSPCTLKNAYPRSQVQQRAVVLTRPVCQGG